MKRWIFLIALGVAGGLIFRRIAFEGVYVPTPSMEPTLPVGTHYIADKASYFFRAPRRGEIVVFESPVEPAKDLVKRVIALPGETVRMEDKTVFVNGKKLEEPYARYTRRQEKLEGDDLPEQKVPEDGYFILGDNRDESGDSATWKDPRTGARILFVRREKIRGRLLNVLE